MENILLVTAGILLGVGFLSAIFSVREQAPIRRHTWSALGAVTYVAGVGAAIGWLMTLQDVPPSMVIAAAILLVLGTVLWAVVIIVNRKTGHGFNVVKQHLVFAGKVALPGWENLDAKTMEAEDRKEVSRINRVMAIGAALVIFPGIVMIMAASIVMNIRGSETSDFLAHSVGYYTLLIATCWTATYIITISIVSLVQIARGKGGGLDLSAVAMSLGTWAGLGAALAVFVGALVPLVVVPLSKGELQLLGMSLLDAISPSLLLDISTAGAVYGFLIGEVISVVNIASREQNLYLKIALPPLLFATVASILGFVGLTPGRLSKELATEYKALLLDGGNTGADPFTTALTQGLDSKEGWANVVVGLDQHGWNDLVDSHVYLILTWVVAVLVALFSMTINIRRRELKLIALDQQALKNP